MDWKKTHKQILNAICRGIRAEYCLRSIESYLCEIRNVIVLRFITIELLTKCSTFSMSHSHTIPQHKGLFFWLLMWRTTSAQYFWSGHLYGYLKIEFKLVNQQANCIWKDIAGFVAHPGARNTFAASTQPVVAVIRFPMCNIDNCRKSFDLFRISSQKWNVRRWEIDNLLLWAADSFDCTFPSLFVTAFVISISHECRARFQSEYAHRRLLRFSGNEERWRSGKKINNVDYDIFNSSFSVSLYAHWRCILNRWKSKSRARFFLTGLAARPSLYSVQGKVINF